MSPCPFGRGLKVVKNSDRYERLCEVESVLF